MRAFQVWVDDLDTDMESALLELRERIARLEAVLARFEGGAK